MENNTQGIRSEMEKTGEPKSGSLNRRSYYTNIRFSFEKKKDTVESESRYWSNSYNFGIKK